MQHRTRTCSPLAPPGLTASRPGPGNSRTPIVYVPREQLADNNLRDSLVDTALTLGHFHGEGHCEYEVELD